MDLTPPCKVPQPNPRTDDETENQFLSFLTTTPDLHTHKGEIPRSRQKNMAAKTLIVTGASRGIGLAAARYLIDHSHNVVVLARGKEALEKLQSEYPKQVRVVVGDMADFAFAQTAVEMTVKEFGQIDGLIINHGTLSPVTIVGNCDIEAWKQNFNVNFFSAVAFAKAALPSLRKSNGRIIFTSSGAATTAYGSWGAYGSSKAALTHLAKTISTEEPNVTSIAIRPGVVDTQMQKELRDTHADAMLEKEAAKFYKLHKAGELLKPEQPATVMARLVLEGPRELSGEFLK